MRFYTEYLTFKTAKHREFINITDRVETALRKSGVQEGMVLVSAMHITAGVWVNDAEDGLLADIDEWLEKLAPFRQDYRHHRTGETNGDSHLKSLLVHHEVIVPVTKGKLDFGPWQQVYYAEFDGQRRETRHPESDGRISFEREMPSGAFPVWRTYEAHLRSILLLSAVLALPADLPVREVVLYKHGVGLFRTLRQLGPGESARLDFNASEMNDVLKSLTIDEKGGGKISGLRYDSMRSARPQAGRVSFPHRRSISR